MEQHLTSSGILKAWEAGAGHRPLDRALAVLWAAGIPGDLAALPMAERDRVLLQVRAARFGRALPVQAACPDCGEILEMTLDARDLALALPEIADEVVIAGDDEISLRALTSRDIAVASAAKPKDVPGVLRGCATGRAELSEAVMPEVDARIEAREAEGELTTRLTCVACDAVWMEVLDVAALVWVEVEAAALRLLGEIAELAAAFGWAEREIVALSAPRRHAYLRLARGG